jgi:hypothetical protein
MKSTPTFYSATKIKGDGCIDIDNVVACINEQHWKTAMSPVDLMTLHTNMHTSKSALCQACSKRATTGTGANNNKVVFGLRFIGAGRQGSRSQDLKGKRDQSADVAHTA